MHLKRNPNNKAGDNNSGGGNSSSNWQKKDSGSFGGAKSSYGQPSKVESSGGPSGQGNRAVIIDSDYVSINIHVNKRESIHQIKSFLSLRQSKKDSKKTCKVIFIIAGQKIELPDSYAITKNDKAKLENIESVKVEAF